MANLLLSPHTQTHTNGHTHTVYRWCIKLTLTIITNAHKIGHTHTHGGVYDMMMRREQINSTNAFDWYFDQTGMVTFARRRRWCGADRSIKCVLVVSRSFVVFVSSIQLHLQHNTLYYIESFVQNYIVCWIYKTKSACTSMHSNEWVAL